MGYSQSSSKRDPQETRKTSKPPSLTPKATRERTENPKLVEEEKSLNLEQKYK